MSVEIEPFEPTHVDKVSKIEQESFNDPWPQELFTALSSRPEVTFLLALGSGTVLGYAIGQLESSIHLRDRRMIEHSGHILNIAVSRESRRSGIGTLLMNEMEKHFRKKDAHIIRLEVRASNTEAQCFYTKLGYEHKATAHLYYGNEDAYIMEKTLE